MGQRLDRAHDDLGAATRRQLFANDPVIGEYPSGETHMRADLSRRIGYPEFRRVGCRIGAPDFERRRIDFFSGNFVRKTADRAR